MDIPSRITQRHTLSTQLRCPIPSSEASKVPKTIWNDIYFHLHTAMPMGTQRVFYPSEELYLILYTKEGMAGGAVEGVLLGLELDGEGYGRWVKFRYL